ncbi:hypothetical protein GQ53DRAFT_743966 [Thozetella sp. PMI_491]|nr:hypothetical protein GQ53DRAFT_743966 [Thozetella sp. PMI_491]
MAASLLDLPPEILDSVVEILPYVDLFSACMACKTMHAITERFLYSKFYWSWTFNVPFQISASPSRTSATPPPIMRFLQSLLEKPHLADFVNDVRLEGDSLSRISHYFRGQLPTLPNPGFVLKALSLKATDKLDIPQPDRARWRAELIRGSVDAWVALLLSQIPKLKVLNLEENFIRDSYFIGMILRWALCGPVERGLFQGVADARFKLALDMRYRKTRGNTGDMLSLFYLPSVKHISVSIDNPFPSFSWPSRRSPDPSKLLSLDLTMLREGHLGHILSTTKSLTRLKWSWFYGESLRDKFATDVINLDSIVADLSHVQRTLENLTITAATRMSSGQLEYPPITVQGSFAALTKFDALKRLEAPLPFLMGSMSPDGAQELCRSLPRNLEELCLTDDLYLQEEYGWGGEHFWTAIRVWMENWKASTPRFRKFHLLLRMMDYDDWDPEERRVLRELGVRVGVQVEITKLAGDM